MRGIADLVEHGLQHVLAVDERAPQPAQVVEAERLEADARVIDAQDPAQLARGVGRDVAEAHDAQLGVPQQRLGHDPGRVAQVQDPRVGRATLDDSGDPDDGGHGPERADEAAGAGRLVADHAERHREGLVALAGRQTPDPDLGDHEVRPVNRPFEVGGRRQPHR